MPHKENKVHTAERIMDILLKNSDIPREDINAIHRWFADNEDDEAKSEAFFRKLSKAASYDKNSVYAREMWPQLAKRLGLDPNLIHTPASTRTSNRNRRIPIRKHLIFRVAAVTIPFLFTATTLGLLIFRTGNTPQLPIVGSVAIPAHEQPSTAAPDTLSVVIAENVTHTLPDNSTVRIGKESKIRHRGSFEGERRVELIGEARFNVVKAQNNEDFFTVHTEHLDIKVLGTDFYVRSAAVGDHSEIDLFHGSIEVRAGGQTIRMKPTDHLFFNHITNEVALTTIPYGELRYDEMPGLEFDHTPIAEVLAQVERDFGVRITIEGETPIHQTLVSGNLTPHTDMRGLMEMLKILSGSFDYELRDDEIKIIIQNHK